MTSVNGLPSTGLACPAHRLQLKLQSGFRWPRIPLHLLWAQMEFVRTPLKHTANGSLPANWRTSSPGPDIRTLVLRMLNRSPFLSMLIFQSVGSSFSSSSDPVWWLGHLHTGFPMDILYKSFGRGLPEPAWTGEPQARAFTVNYSFWLKPTCILLLASYYILLNKERLHSKVNFAKLSRLMPRINKFYLSTYDGV